MLDIFRKSAKSLAGLLVIAMSVVLMASFGLDYYQSSPNREAALTINGKEISFQEYRRTYDSLMRMVRNPQFARQYAIDSLINESLFDRFVEEMGLGASRSQVEEKIQENPFFAEGFSKERFRTFLQTTGTTAEQLKGIMESEIAREQLRDAARDLSWFSDAELQALYNQERATYAFRYIRLNPADFVEKVELDDAKLKEFYESNPEPYRKARQARFTYVAFQPADFLAKVEVTEDDLRELYQEDLPELREPKLVQLKKLIFPKQKPETENGKKKKSAASEEPATDEVRKTKAGEASKKLKEGEDFQKLADAMRDDASVKAEVSDLGLVDPRTIDAALQKEAERLDLGEASSVIELPDSYVVLYAADLKPEQKRAFEEVRSILERKIREERAPEYSRSEAENFLAKWTEGAQRNKPLAEYAGENGLAVSTSNGLVEAAVEVGNLPGLSAQANRLNQGEQDIVEIGETAVVIQIDEIKESHIPPIEEVRAQVVERYRKARSRDLAKEFGDALLKEAGVGAESGSRRPLAEIAASHKLPVLDVPATTRASASGELFRSGEVRNVAFTLTKENPIAEKVFESGDSLVVVELAERTLPSPAEFPKERENLIEQERDRAGQRLFAALRARLRDDAEIIQNPSLGGG